MVVIIVLLTIAIFLLVDLALRVALKRREEARLRREREEALDTGLRLDFTEEAASLKRVEVDGARARILAVDDEPVVLDSFRKILVLEGYSVDTVESAPEALGLVRKIDYDFVFTDLKMPDMDGIELTKAVKHLRPDIDVVMITGYGTIESAVETMKLGAMDYVEKPFTADELADFTRKLLIRRQDRIAKQTPPKVRLVTSALEQSRAPDVIDVPGGIYVSDEHSWVAVEITGEARIGLDDFALKTLQGGFEIEFPKQGEEVARGEPLFSIRRGSQALSFTSPLRGKITRINHELAYHLELLERRPFAMGWICCVEPASLSADLSHLRIGADAIAWYESEIEKFREQLRANRQARSEAAPETEQEAAPEESEEAWVAFAMAFLTGTSVQAAS